MLVAFVHAVDVAVHQVQNESADIEFWSNAWDLLGKQTGKLPKSTPDRLTMLELKVHLVLADCSITQKTVVSRCPKSHRLVAHPILLSFIAFQDSSNDRHHVEPFVLL